MNKKKCLKERGVVYIMFILMNKGGKEWVTRCKLILILADKKKSPAQIHNLAFCVKFPFDKWMTWDDRESHTSG